MTVIKLSNYNFLVTFSVSEITEIEKSNDYNRLKTEDIIKKTIEAEMLGSIERE